MCPILCPPNLSIAVVNTSGNTNFTQGEPVHTVALVLLKCGQRKLLHSDEGRILPLPQVNCWLCFSLFQALWACFGWAGGAGFSPSQMVCNLGGNFRHVTNCGSTKYSQDGV